MCAKFLKRWVEDESSCFGEIDIEEFLMGCCWFN
jgi:hypothetical protein